MIEVEIKQMFATNDLEIRQAFHKKKLKVQHSDENTLVIDELGLLHGSNRIDIAVVNGCIHGYEIKSSKDTLGRFEDQLKAYSQTLQKLTVVSAPNHVDDVLKLSPEWVGVMVADKGSKGGIHFRSLRQAKKNPNINPLKVAHLLWKDETLAILEELGLPPKLRKGNRQDLYRNLVEHISLEQLVSSIKLTFMERTNWRSDVQPV
ncbi:sce7726 family protein [Vibrio mediterranei]|uniref:sce7726 family protein n=1 Tax=Vibrio mediterranei TaxID=689 RepID=UPI0038CF9727